MRASSHHLTLGGLIDGLKRLPQDQPVYYDFARFVPTSLESYRGYYEDLALGYRERDARDARTGNLCTACMDAVGRLYTGYKGGNYRMVRDTPIWVANRGEAVGTYLVGVRTNDYATILLTATDEVEYPDG